MTASHPQTIGSRLFDQVEDLLNDTQPPSEFSLRRLDAEADKLVKVSPAEGLTAKAGLAALRWDIPEVQRLVANCVRVDASVITLTNSALTLKAVHLLDEGCPLMAKALQRAPKDADVVTEYVDYFMAAGRFLEAAEVMKKALDEGLIESEFETDVLGLAADMVDWGIDPERLRQEMSCAFHVLAKHKRRTKAIRYDRQEEPDGGGSMLILLGFDGSLEDEMRLEAELAVELAEGEDWNPVLLGVGYEALQEHAHQPI